MKLVFKTKTKTEEKTYLVRLPNYFDTDNVEKLLEEIKYDLLSTETIIEHHFYGDTALTLDERKQVDIYGEVINPPEELTFTM